MGIEIRIYCDDCDTVGDATKQRTAAELRKYLKTQNWTRGPSVLGYGRVDLCPACTCARAERAAGDQAEDHGDAS